MKLYVVTADIFGTETESLLGVWTSIEEAKSRLDEYVREELVDVDSTEDLYRREYMDGTIGFIRVAPLNKFVWEVK